MKKLVKRLAWNLSWYLPWPERIRKWLAKKGS